MTDEMEEEAAAEAKRRVLELVAEASGTRMEPSVPLRRYYRSLNEMFRMGEVYVGEGDLEHALTLFIRFTTLWLEALPAHPRYASEDGALEKAKAKQRLVAALDQAERLKPQLRQRFHQEALDRLRLQAKERREAERRAQLATPAATLQPQPSFQPPPPYAASQAPVPAPRTPRDLPPPYSADALPSPPMEAPGFPSLDDFGGVGSLGTVPSVEGFDAGPSGPRGGVPSVDRSTKPSGPPPVDRSLKSSLSSGSYGGGLREVLVPSSLVAQFATLAAGNTGRNVETCGILGGRPEGGGLRVTTLVVPAQSGTSDSCTTEGEEELFLAMDSRDVVTLGWVHTHPSQTAFLSSVDMHTQASYQLMLPEALAIVYSPKYQETGLFHLTPPQGLQEIADCRQSGFHPHNQVPPCFQVAAHANDSVDLPLEIVDLRK